MSSVFAWGSDERELARLGNAMSCSCAREFVELAEEREEVDLWACDMMCLGCFAGR